MKRFTSLLNRTRSSDNTPRSSLTDASADSPEANGVQAIRQFCESGSNSNGGEEVLHLPVIVEAAESSPSAAAASAQQIRRFLSKEWSSKPHVQYNSIMLVRILSDNPGPTFTRNFDKPFVTTVKELLRNSKDHSTQQILRETLDNLEVSKAHDEGCALLIQMWRKEKGHTASLNNQRSSRVAERQWQSSYATPADHQWQQQQHQQPVYTNGSQQYGNSQRSGGHHQLPPPFELASRIEEARNTGKILMQLLQSTPPHEVSSNDLIKEFNERCQSAQKSMQSYISADSPPPDDDTLQTLIETNEQLSLASSRYQRAILAARRAVGSGDSSAGEVATEGNGIYSQLPPQQPQSLFAAAPTLPPQSYDTSTGSSLFGQPDRGSNSLGYVPPPGPPPTTSQQQPPPRVSPNSSPSTQNHQPPVVPPKGPVTVPFSDPFADPLEHEANPAPLAIEPTNYGRAQFLSSQASQDQRPPSGHARHNTAELEDAYSVTPLQPTSSNPATVSGLSPNMGNSSPSRPGPEPWHNSGITPSYLGRQVSAADGLTMHGAQTGENVAEIDSNSSVGRRERDRTPRSPTANGPQQETFQVASGETTPRTMRRVDVAGTGGFRSSIIGRPPSSSKT